MTFDIIGELTFGQSFDCLENGELHPWVALLPGAARTMTCLLALKHAPSFIFKIVLAAIMPFLNARNEHAEFTNEKIKIRLSDDRVRRDFINPILKYMRTRPPTATEGKFSETFTNFYSRANDEKGVTYPELESSINLLVTAGKRIVWLPRRMSQS